MGALDAADATTLDALARMQLAATRVGFALRLARAAPELRELIEFVGLAGVLPCEVQE